MLRLHLGHENIQLHLGPAKDASEERCAQTLNTALRTSYVLVLPHSYDNCYIRRDSPKGYFGERSLHTDHLHFLVLRPCIVRNTSSISLKMAQNRTLTLHINLLSDIDETSCDHLILVMPCTLSITAHLLHALTPQRRPKSSAHHNFTKPPEKSIAYHLKSAESFGHSPSFNLIGQAGSTISKNPPGLRFARACSKNFG